MSSQKRVQKLMSDALTVSIIIPTFNSEKTIARCLKSIRSQTYSKAETIVVDRYSGDNTVKIAEEFRARALLKKSERSAAKNYGAEKAKGRFLLFIDSDMELNPEVVEECVVAYLQMDVDAVDIPEVSVAKGFLAECRKIEKALYTGDPDSFKMPRSFKKEVFRSVGGFDENLVFGEDFDLCWRIERGGYKIGRIRVAIKHHEGELSMKRIALRAYQYGKTLPFIIGKNPSLAMRGYCPTRYLRNLKMLLKCPHHLIGLIFMKLVEYIAYLGGALSTIFE